MAHYAVTMDILEMLLPIVMSEWVMEQKSSVHYVIPTITMTMTMTKYFIQPL